MRNRKITTWLLAGMITASTIGLYMLTGCGTLSSDRVREPAQQVLPEESTGTESAAQTEATAETDENAIRFTTVDLNGSPVSESIFQDADFTLVYAWATYCGPCIMEMPDYEELYENLPERVNLIGLVCDVYEGDTQGVQAAQDILDDAGAKFKNIVVSDSVAPLISDMQFTPSAFFVDRQGHMVDFMDGGGIYESEERLSELVE